MEQEGRTIPLAAEQSRAGITLQVPAVDSVNATRPGEGLTKVSPEGKMIIRSGDLALSQATGKSGEESENSYTYTYESGRRSRKSSAQIILSNLKAAKLEERRKFLALEELENQIKDKREMEKRCRQLDGQTRDALREREEIAKKLSEERRLYGARWELEEAKLVASLIEGDDIKQVANMYRAQATHVPEGRQKV